MKSGQFRLAISTKYDSAIFEAVTIQIVLGLLSKMMMDPGELAQICGVALIAFWGGTVVLIWRHPNSPSRVDLELIRFGFLIVFVLAFFLVGYIWRLRGFR